MSVRIPRRGVGMYRRCTAVFCGRVPTRFSIAAASYHSLGAGGWEFSQWRRSRRGRLVAGGGEADAPLTFCWFCVISYVLGYGPLLGCTDTGLRSGFLRRDRAHCRPMGRALHVTLSLAVTSTPAHAQPIQRAHNGMHSFFPYIVSFALVTRALCTRVSSLTLLHTR